MQFYYSQIPALKALPKSERFRTYRSANKSLLKGNPDYRRHWTVYLWSLFAVVLIEFTCEDYFHHFGGIISFLSLASIIALVLWQQNYMNHQIDAFLKGQRDESQCRE